METLHTKYRPKTLADVVGQAHVTDRLPDVMHHTQSFLFHGPSGCGKTTIARILADMLGCDDVTEIDGATHTGIDAMREVMDSAKYLSLSGGGRAFIVDECHQLSKATWQALLKMVEEPPAGVYWIFCTTEPTKVPPTVRTRVQQYALNAVHQVDLEALVKRVVDAEGLHVDPLILEEVVINASGSPRQALVYLGQVSTASNVAEARRLMNQAHAGPEAYDLAKLIYKRTFSLPQVKKILTDMRAAKVENEGIRIVVFEYGTTAALNDGDEWINIVMSEFSQPCVEQNRIGDLWLRVARLDYRRKK